MADEEIYNSNPGDAAFQYWITSLEEKNQSIYTIHLKNNPCNLEVYI